MQLVDPQFLWALLLLPLVWWLSQPPAWAASSPGPAGYRRLVWPPRRRSDSSAIEKSLGTAKSLIQCARPTASA